MHPEHLPEDVENSSPGPLSGKNLSRRAVSYGDDQAPTMADRVSRDTIGMDNLSDNVAWSSIHPQCTELNNYIHPQSMLNVDEAGLEHNLEQENIPTRSTFCIVDVRSHTTMSPQDAEYAASFYMPHMFDRQIDMELGPSEQGGSDPWNSSASSWVSGCEGRATPQHSPFPAASSTSVLGNIQWPSSTPVFAVTPSPSSNSESVFWRVNTPSYSLMPVCQNIEGESELDFGQSLPIPNMEQDRMFHPHLPTRLECDLAASAGIQGQAAMTKSPRYCVSVPDNVHQTSATASPTPSEISITPSDVSDTLVCPIDGCNVRFTGRFRRGNLGRHKRLIHEEARFPCYVNRCGKIFNRPDALLKHRRKHHAFDLPLLKPPEPRKHRGSF